MRVELRGRIDIDAHMRVKTAAPYLTLIDPTRLYAPLRVENAHLRVVLCGKTDIHAHVRATVRGRFAALNF